MAKADGPWGGGTDGEAEKPADAPGGSGPRNPWLTPDQELSQRRSASIEDILRVGKGGPGGGLGAPRRWLPWLALGTLSAWLAATSIHVLAQDERALVMTMGRYSETIGPGFNVTMPWPLQSVIRRQTGKEVTTALPDKGAEVLMPTRDGELIDLSFQVRWRISDLRQFAFNLPEGEDAVRRLADAQMRAAVAEMPFDAIWGGKRQAELQQRAMGRIQAVLNAWHSGVTVTGIEVTRADPPSRLAETTQKIGQANDEARKNREQADAWRERHIREARAEAAAFEQVYAEYQIAPAVTRQKMYYETMERVLRNNPVVVGGTSAPAASLPPGPDGKPAQPQGGQ